MCAQGCYSIAMEAHGIYKPFFRGEKAFALNRLSKQSLYRGLSHAYKNFLAFSVLAMQKKHILDPVIKEPLIRTSNPLIQGNPGFPAQPINF